MTLFISMKKIAMQVLILGVLLIQSNFAIANDLSNCDYDDVFYGYGELTISNGNYSFAFEGMDGNGYVFTGSADAPVVSQIQYALANAKMGESGGEEIVVLMSMNKPVCASVVETLSLYVQPGIIEKQAYYVVGVCFPESSDCWNMKIGKSSHLATTLKRNGKLEFEGKVCVISSSPDGDILSLYEDTNADY